MPLPDQTRQSLTAGIARDQTQIHFGLTESRAVGGEAQRARHRQFASTTEREAVDGGDHRLAEILDRIKQQLTATRVLFAFDRREDGQLVDVGASNERLLARSGQNDRANGRIGLEIAECGFELAEGLTVKRVQRPWGG